MVSSKLNVTVLPDTVAVIESAPLNTNCSLPGRFTEPALEALSPIANVPPATESTYALIDC